MWHVCDENIKMLCYMMRTSDFPKYFHSELLNYSYPEYLDKRKDVTLKRKWDVFWLNMTTALHSWNISDGNTRKHTRQEGVRLDIYGVTETKRKNRQRNHRTGESEWKGYTHSIVAGVALRQPSCQFSTGTGMQVSLMVSWQRKDRGGPLSSSSWALLWTVSTTERRGLRRGRRRQRSGRGRGGGLRWRVKYAGMGTRGQERRKIERKTRKTQKHMKQEQQKVRQESRVEPLVEPRICHNVWI